MNWKKEIVAALGFCLLLAVCLFTEPIVDSMTARAAVVEPEPSAVVVEIERIELPEEQEPEPVETFYNPTPLKDAEYRVLLETCERCRIAPSLALGLIQVESRFDPNAKSKSGCYGYCQLNPKYFEKDLSPVENIRQGIEYLAYQCERYKSTESGLDAYHNGHETGETSYARAVLNAAEKWAS